MVGLTRGVAVAKHLATEAVERSEGLDEAVTSLSMALRLLMASRFHRHDFEQAMAVLSRTMLETARHKADAVSS